MSRAKQTLLTWAVVYPVITTLLWLGDPLLGDMPLAVRTFVVTAVLVPMMSYILMPAAQHFLHRVNGH